MKDFVNPEDALIDGLDDKRLSEIFLPGIKAILKAGGGADAILKGSKTLAAVRIASTAMTGDPSNALKAAETILNRTDGKAVERRLNIYADVADMSEEQLDREIYSLARRADVKEVIELLAEPKRQTIKVKPKRTHLSTRVKADE